MNFPINQDRDYHILVVTSVAAEKDAVLRGLNASSSFDVVTSGVGSAAAAAATASALSRTRYDLVVSAGIGGGFEGQAEVGSLVIANEIIAADLGAETESGFQTIEEIGMGPDRVIVDEGKIDIVKRALRSSDLVINIGPVLTLSTVTGTAQTAEKLARQVPGAAAEAMEGFGAATAAEMFGVDSMEIRAISNTVGPRDRSAWRITEALETLEAASSILSEVLIE